MSRKIWHKILGLFGAGSLGNGGVEAEGAFNHRPMLSGIFEAHPGIPIPPPRIPDPAGGKRSRYNHFQFGINTVFFTLTSEIIIFSME